MATCSNTHTWRSSGRSVKTASSASAVRPGSPAACTCRALDLSKLHCGPERDPFVSRCCCPRRAMPRPGQWRHERSTIDNGRPLPDMLRAAGAMQPRRTTKQYPSPYTTSLCRAPSRDGATRGSRMFLIRPCAMSKSVALKPTAASECGTAPATSRLHGPLVAEEPSSGLVAYSTGRELFVCDHHIRHARQVLISGPLAPSPMSSPPAKHQHRAARPAAPRGGNDAATAAPSKSDNAKDSNVYDALMAQLSKLTTSVAQPRTPRAAPEEAAPAADDDRVQISSISWGKGHGGAALLAAATSLGVAVWSHAAGTGTKAALVPCASMPVLAAEGEEPWSCTEFHPTAPGVLCVASRRALLLVRVLPNSERSAAPEHRRGVQHLVHVTPPDAGPGTSRAFRCCWDPSGETLLASWGGELEVLRWGGVPASRSGPDSGGHNWELKSRRSLLLGMGTSSAVRAIASASGPAGEPDRFVITYDAPMTLRAGDAGASEAAAAGVAAGGGDADGVIDLRGQTAPGAPQQGHVIVESGAAVPSMFLLSQGGGAGSAAAVAAGGAPPAGLQATGHVCLVDISGGASGNAAGGGRGRPQRQPSGSVVSVGVATPDVVACGGGLLLVGSSLAPAKLEVFLVGDAAEGLMKGGSVWLSLDAGETDPRMRLRCLSASQFVYSGAGDAGTVEVLSMSVKKRSGDSPFFSSALSKTDDGTLCVARHAVPRGDFLPARDDRLDVSLDAERVANPPPARQPAAPDAHSPASPAAVGPSPSSARPREDASARFALDVDAQAVRSRAADAGLAADLLRQSAASQLLVADALRGLSRDVEARMGRVEAAMAGLVERVANMEAKLARAGL
ncbi:unnamed protein product [Pedinophyceae sp. YPF-701]|nr:unnamed protein product [Pedinophyceae sp. YPF-701]